MFGSIYRVTFIDFSDNNTQKHEDIIAVRYPLYVELIRELRDRGFSNIDIKEFKFIRTRTKEESCYHLQ